VIGHGVILASRVQCEVNRTATPGFPISCGLVLVNGIRPMTRNPSGSERFLAKTTVQTGRGHLRRSRVCDRLSRRARLPRSLTRKKLQEEWNTVNNIIYIVGVVVVVVAVLAFFGLR
jgi:hypothetical protein